MQFYEFDSNPGKYYGYSSSYRLVGSGESLRVERTEVDRGPSGTRPGDWPEERTVEVYSLNDFRVRFARDAELVACFEKALASLRPDA